MHWSAYPSPETAKHNKQAQHNLITMCCENSRCDWQNIKMARRKSGSKSAYIVPSPKCKCFTDTEAEMDISFAFVDFSN